MPSADDRVLHLFCRTTLTHSISSFRFYGESRFLGFYKLLRLCLVLSMLLSAETSAGDATPSPESTSQAQSNAKPNASAIAGVTEALAALSIHNPPDSDASAATGTNQVTTTVGEATSSAPENEMVNEQPVVDECDGDSNTERVKGRVKWFNVNRGYGFISRSGQSDVFVYQVCSSLFYCSALGRIHCFLL